MLIIINEYRKKSICKSRNILEEVVYDVSTSKNIFLQHTRSDDILKTLLNNQKGGRGMHLINSMLYRVMTNEWQQHYHRQDLFFFFFFFLFVFVLIIIIIIINHLWNLAIRTIDPIPSSPPTAISSVFLSLLLHLLQVVLALKISDDHIDLWSITKKVLH